MQTLTALYETFQAAQGAVYELRAAGIPDRDISLISTRTKDAFGSEDHSGATTGASAGAGLGLLAGGTGGLLTGLGVMAIPGVGPVVAAGWLAAMVAGAAAGAVVGGATGGIIGALTDSGLSENDAHVYAEAVRRGGTLITVRVPEEKVVETDAILDRFQRVDVGERRRDYTEGGWNSFEPSLPPYNVTVSEDTRRADNPTGR